MRDRLIELIKRDNCMNPLFCSSKCKYAESDDCHSERLADLILADGWIRPPCKVGDKTFLLLEKIKGGYDIVESQCVRIVADEHSTTYSMYLACEAIGNTLEFGCEDFGKTVFLTREEAEQKLKEGKG